MEGHRIPKNATFSFTRGSVALQEKTHMKRKVKQRNKNKSKIIITTKIKNQIKIYPTYDLRKVAPCRNPKHTKKPHFQLAHFTKALQKKKKGK